jgi:hypothetical protein
MITIKRYDLTHVIKNDKKLFNTNNHFLKDGREKPKDYFEVGNKCNTCNWINQFHKIYHVITLNSSDLFWMKKAAHIGCRTGTFPEMYLEELFETCQKYEFFKGEW